MTKPLSKIDGPRQLMQCQNCAKVQPNNGTIYWQEHDLLDNSSFTVVALCRECSKKLIEPHPRLYREIMPLEPFPGIMAICAECRWRHGVSCKHPKAATNGGPGLEIRHDQPRVLHVDLVVNGERTSLNYPIYTSPPSGCSGKDAVLIADDPARNLGDDHLLQTYPNSTK